jgi:putative oxidoreductase
MKIPFLIGRVVFGGFFLYNAIHHFRDRKQLSEYAGAKNVPAPDIATILSGLLLLTGGSSVLLGIRPKLGIAAIVAFLAGVSPMIHDFWHAEDPAQRMNDQIHFSKNLALLGAALALMGVKEPWPVSIPID